MKHTLRVSRYDMRFGRWWPRSEDTMTSLIDYGSSDDEQYVFRGMKLVLPGEYPHEEWLEVIVFDPLDQTCGMGLLITTGRKSGLPLVVLPKESLGSGIGAISTDWLKRNFQPWVYDVPLNRVFVKDHAVAPPPPS